MTPVFRVLADNKDITAAIAENLVSIHHHDQRGFESDTLNITIKDDGTLELPAEGVALSVHLGWEGDELTDRGSFIVDDVAQEDQGDGDMIIIDCKSADMNADLKSKKTRSWEDSTLGDVASDVAGDHGLKVRVSGDLSAIAISKEHQTGESDLNLITRLALKHDALAKISDGYLVITPRNAGKTVSGASLSSVEITRSKGDTHHYSKPKRDSMTKASGTNTALYRDVKTGATHKVAVGSGDPVRQISNQVYGSKQEAVEAAAGDNSKRTGRQEKISLNLVVANVDLFAETPTTLSGYRAEIDGDGWFVDSIDTTLDESGLYQSVGCERGIK